MMKIQKPVMTLLLCAALFGVLTGCGKTEETTDIPDAVQTSAQEESVLSADAETEAETAEKEKSKKETSKSEESDTDAESETSGEEDSDTKTESDSAQNSETTTSTTAASGTASTTTAETKTQQDEQSPQQEEAPAEDNNPPDVPAEVMIVTEAPVLPVDAPDPDAGAVTEPPAEEDNSTDDLSLTVNYQGYGLTVGESAKAFIDAVKPNSEESAPSCYGDGENINYYYDDMTVYVWNENDNYMIYGIDINSPGVVSVKGLDIGSAATFDGEKIYYGNCFRRYSYRNQL